MYCWKCGNRINENEKYCSKCGQKVNESVPQQQSPSNIVGKYSFTSTRGIRFGLFTSIFNEITIVNDRMHITTIPKKCNYAPMVLLSDIMGVTVTNKIALEHILAAIAFFFAGIVLHPIIFIAIPFLIWFGKNKKIIISHRNGKDIIIYSNSKTDAEQFKRDMQQLLNRY